MTQSQIEDKVQNAGNNGQGQKTARSRFLNCLTETGSVRLAAEASGKVRAHWQKLRQQDKKFARAWEQAVEAYVEVLEAEADRRALCGDQEPIFYGGKQIGIRSKPSDSLLMFRLKALRPARYKDVGAEDTTQVKVEVRSFRDIPTEENAPESQGEE